MQYRSVIGHAPANFALTEQWFCYHCSLCFAKQIPSEVGPRPGGTFLKKSTSLSVLTSSFAMLAFSKYWRAQIAPITDWYCIYRFFNWFFTVLRLRCFLCVSWAQIAPFSDLYCMKVGFAIFIFTDYSKLKNAIKWKKMRDTVPSFFESLMFGVVFRDTSDFFYLHIQEEKKRR